MRLLFRGEMKRHCKRTCAVVAQCGEGLPDAAGLRMAWRGGQVVVVKVGRMKAGCRWVQLDEEKSEEESMRVVCITLSQS